MAVNSTYYVGGASSFNDKINDDQQDDSGVGISVVVPNGKLRSLKLAARIGVVVRVGQDF